MLCPLPLATGLDRLLAETVYWPRPLLPRLAGDAFGGDRPMANKQVFGKWRS